MDCIKNIDDVKHFFRYLYEERKVAFHPAIADEFKDFLVAKMVMESPSHSRHKDMVIYKEEGKYYLKLALQLRFTLNR